jgi:PAS domain S-box-containing protein
MHATEGVASDAARAWEHERFAGRYDVVKPLKIGKVGQTLLAVDSTTAHQVVLKIFESVALDPSAHARFLHETRILRELSGTGVCALHDAGQTDAYHYLAQQYVPGVTLEELLRPGPVSVSAALRIGIALAAALDLAHGAGITHRDVKPANIIVDGLHTAAESVTLIDFGFASSRWLAESLRDDLVGTVRYMSPEAAGLLGTVPDERADLYALGVVLFECLAGRPPYDSDSVSELLRQHSSSPVPDLRAHSPEVPSALAAAVERLLRKDPAERYQSAAAVSSDLELILAAVETGDRDPAIVIGRKDRRLTLTDPAFVGRESECARLTTMATNLANAGGGLCLLDADSGGGKSRLLTEVANRAREAGVLVLEGQGIQHGGQPPFTLLHGVADGLVEALRDDPARAAALATAVQDVAPAITRALPALAAMLPANPRAADMGPEEFGDMRSLAALRRLLTSAADRDRPILVVLDDCQWSDSLTVRLLAEMFGDSSTVPPHLSVIAAFRAEEVPAEHPLRRISGAHTLHLGPLSRKSVELLVESMAGPLPRAALDTVVRLADGNPFMAGAVLRGLVESEALIPDPDGWTVDDSRLSDVQAARRSAAFLVRRLELLDEAALNLLSVGAVLGKQFDVATAVSIVGLSELAAAAILADARRRRLVWLSTDSSSCTFFHDKIRESLLARLDVDERRRLHGLAADGLIRKLGAEPGDVVFDLAYHLHEAGRLADALPYSIASAELARSRYALDVAAAHYRMAEEAIAAAADQSVRRRVAEGLGDVLMLTGNYGEAREHLTAARELVVEPSEAAALDGKLGALAFKQADIPTAKLRLEGALRLLGRRLPGGPLLFLGLVWELLVQAGHSLLPRLTTGRRSAAGRDEDFLAMRLYSRLAYLYWFHSGKVACAWAHLRGMNLAERYLPSSELGQAWSEHAPVMTMLPWYGRGVRYAQRSLDVRRELGDVWGQGQSLNFTGVVKYAASDFPAAQAACDEASRLLRRTGDQWEVNTADWNRALCHLRVGELRTAVQICEETFATARSIGDQTAAGIALSIWARASEGRVPAELVQELLAQGNGDAQTTAELHLADALVNRALGNVDAALACVERGISAVKDAGLRQEYIAPLFPWHATLAREQALAVPAYAPELRRRRLAAATRVARRAVRWARFYRNNEPHARRELGLILALRGRDKRAVRQLARSADAATRIGARYEEALTALARAELVAATTDTSFEVEVAAGAVRAFDPLAGTTAGGPAASSISVFDRFTTLLKVGRDIASATTERSLEQAIRTSTLALLRAERCHLVPVAALYDYSLTTRSGDRNVHGLSRTLLLEAVNSGRPTMALDESPSASDSLVLSGIRSALAVPILVGGEPRLLVYATHGQLGQMFGDEEAQLAEFIATLAGAAFEHLLGSETRFRSLVQSSSDVVSLVNDDGVITYQSAALQRVFGLPPAGLLGTSFVGWAHPDDAKRVSDVLLAAAVPGTANTTFECRLQHADGSYRFVESTITNLIEEPTVAALVINTRDITDRTEAVQQLHVAEERERIARDLHDVVIQRLFAVGLHLDGLSEELADEQATATLSAADELRDTIRDIRGAIFTLRSDRYGLTLSERLMEVITRVEQMLGFRPDVHVAAEIDHQVPDTLHWHLIATVNEALSNVVRHARASELRVTVSVVGDELVARIADNGQGLPGDREESGLRNLRRRAETAGGTMTTTAGPRGAGLVLTWRVPLRTVEGD